MSSELGDNPSSSPTKQNQRDNRFSNPLGIRKGSEALVDQRLLEELGEMALKFCHPEQKVFADCAKKWNLGVIFMCRGENDAMNECIRQFTNEDSLAAYKKKKLAQKT
jgi:hypothetical protein|tara:strand:- start:399 stop:722 length:324 start_codon:yes stop_codon:yes gene_type:complete